MAMTTNNSISVKPRLRITPTRLTMESTPDNEKQRKDLEPLMIAK